MADLIATPRALRPTKFPLRKVQLVRKPQPIDPHSIYLSPVVLERTQFYIAYYYIVPCRYCPVEFDYYSPRTRNVGVVQEVGGWVPNPNLYVVLCNHFSPLSRQSPQN